VLTSSKGPPDDVSEAGTDMESDEGDEGDILLSLALRGRAENTKQEMKSSISRVKRTTNRRSPKPRDVSGYRISIIIDIVLPHKSIQSLQEHDEGSSLTPRPERMAKSVALANMISVTYAAGTSETNPAVIVTNERI